MIGHDFCSFIIMIHVIIKFSVHNLTPMICSWCSLGDWIFVLNLSWSFSYFWLLYLVYFFMLYDFIRNNIMFILVLTVDLVSSFVFTQFHSYIFRITDARVGDRRYEVWIIFNVSSALMTTFVIDSSISFNVIMSNYDSVLFIDLILYTIISLEYITFLRVLRVVFCILKYILDLLF